MKGRQPHEDALLLLDVCRRFLGISAILDQSMGPEDSVELLISFVATILLAVQLVYARPSIAVHFHRITQVTRTLLADLRHFLLSASVPPQIRDLCRLSEDSRRTMITTPHAILSIAKSMKELVVYAGAWGDGVSRVAGDFLPICDGMTVLEEAQGIFSSIVANSR